MFRMTTTMERSPATCSTPSAVCVTQSKTGSRVDWYQQTGAPKREWFDTGIVGASEAASGPARWEPPARMTQAGGRGASLDGVAPSRVRCCEPEDVEVHHRHAGRDAQPCGQARAPRGGLTRRWVDHPKSGTQLASARQQPRMTGSRAMAQTWHTTTATGSTKQGANPRNPASHNKNSGRPCWT
jgi:hypothetical protein